MLCFGTVSLSEWGQWCNPLHYITPVLALYEKIAFRGEGVLLFLHLCIFYTLNDSAATIEYSHDTVFSHTTVAAPVKCSCNTALLYLKIKKLSFILAEL